MKENVIIGAGLSGLICSHYIPSSKIIEKSEKYGGDMKTRQEIDAYNSNKPISDKYTLGLKYLHPCKEFDALYNDFRLEQKTKKFTSKIFYDGEFRDFNFQMPERMRTEYFEKTRKQKAGNVDLDKLKVMNSVKTELIEEGITNIDALTYCLKSAADIRQPLSIDYINIDKKEILTDADITLKYKNLISTIPLPELGHLLHKNFDLNHTHLYFCALTFDKPVDKGADYIYFPEKEIEFHRVTFQGKTVVAEISSEKYGDYAEKVKDRLFELELIDASVISTSYHFQEYGHFQYHTETETELEEIKNFLSEANIHTAGRYANWNHEEKMDSTIKNILKLRDEIK